MYSLVSLFQFLLQPMAVFQSLHSAESSDVHFVLRLWSLDLSRLWTVMWDKYTRQSLVVNFHIVTRHSLLWLVWRITDQSILRQDDSSVISAARVSCMRVFCETTKLLIQNSRLFVVLIVIASSKRKVILTDMSEVITVGEIGCVCILSVLMLAKKKGICGNIVKGSTGSTSTSARSMGVLLWVVTGLLLHIISRIHAK